ncbi:MAG: FecR domain-containing protein, partial [Oscillospiraceae bacterium]
MNKRTKSKISLFLSMAVLTSMLSLSAYAADSAVAVNMNIESYQGNVLLKKSDGKKLTVKEKLRLYSGNVLSTELKSYVIINLDDKKAVKLDEKSKVIVKKKNKKQELLVEEGNLFFNIKEKLADDEVLEIRTSTMVTGIRGTSGYVITDDKGNSTLYILDGEVTIQYEDPVTHEKREVTINGGQSAQLNNTTNENGEIISSEMLITPISPNELPPYVALELLEDDALQERIHGDTGWLVKEIAENAKKNLQAAQDENAKREENARNENSAASENHGAANGDGKGGAVDPLFPDGELDNPPVPPPATTIAPPPDNPTPPTPPTTPTNPTSPTNPTPPTNPPTPPTPPTPPPVPPTETVLTGAVTSAQLKAAFAADKPELVVLNSADITLSEPVSVPMGKKLELRSGTNKISGNELTVSGEMSINAAASAEISGKLTVGTGLRGRAALQSTLNINGKVNINNGATIAVVGG